MIASGLVSCQRNRMLSVCWSVGEGTANRMPLTCQCGQDSDNVQIYRQPCCRDNVHPRTQSMTEYVTTAKLTRNGKWPFKGSRLQNSPYFCVFKFARTVKQKVWGEAENGERDWGDTLKWVEVAVRRQSLCLLLEKGESRKSRTLQIIVECEAVVSKNKSAILKSRWIKAENVIVALTRKRWNVTKVGRSSEKTNFSLS